MKRTIALVLATLAGACYAEEASPLARRQQEFLSWKFGMFIHFNMGTFVGKEWALGCEDPALFKPDKLDCGQWADAAKAAGMKYAVLTVKHTEGYCLWPSRCTTHGIQSFKNFKNCQGDIVRQFADAFRARGLKVGLYYCFPGDYTRRKGMPDGSPNLYGLAPEAAGDFPGFIKKQMSELLGNYGRIDMIWCDQHMNMLKRQQWLDIKAHIQSLQPECVVLANNAKDVDVSDVVSYEAPWRKDAFPADNALPAEVSDILDKRGWFWHGPPKPEDLKSAQAIVDKLKSLNRQNCNYLLDVPPGPDGLLDPLYVERLREIGALLSR